MNRPDELSREAVIRSAWKARGFEWDPRKNGPRIRIPFPREAPPWDMVAASTSVSEPISESVLEYEYQPITLQGQPGYRVVCEGITVEEGYR